MRSCVSVFLWLIFTAFAKPTYSEDTQAAVLKRMQPEFAIKIAYQETRYLELMHEPWQASGFLYALPPDVLVKEQRTPVRELMGVIGDKMFYYDPTNGIRHHSVIEPDDPLSLNVAAFKALVTGDKKLLVKMYRIDFSPSPEHWTLTLTGHEDNDSTIKIEVTGDTGQQASQITVQQPDGDRNEFILAEAARGEHLEKPIQELNQELLGH